MKHLLYLLVLCFALFPTAYAGTIKKCQDAQGNWHYGDRATEKCKQSKIIELNGKGTKTNVIEAPPTEDQLETREQQRLAEERKEKRAEAQLRRDKLLLSTYGHENDIIYVRDRKLAQIESNITASNETLKTLRATLERMQKNNEPEEHIKRNQAQIERHEKAIATKRTEQEQLKQQYAQELERYREIKAQIVEAK